MVTQFISAMCFAVLCQIYYENLLCFSCSLLIYLLISQEQNFSEAMERRCIALLSAFSTAMLILSNLVFLGGIHVGRIFWKRVIIQGKLPPTTLTQQDSYVPFFHRIVSADILKFVSNVEYQSGGLLI